MLAAESSAAQPTSSAVRTLETEDDASAKRQRLMAGMPIMHETDVDVNVDVHMMVVLAAIPDGRGQWTQRVIDWDKKYYGAKSGTLLYTQKVHEGRLRELANIEKLEAAEPIQLQEARAQNLEIVDGKWLDDAKGTPEDPDAIRSRLVATQVNTYVREDVTQATPPIRIIVSQAATKTQCKGPARLFDCQTRHQRGVLPCEEKRASRDHPSKGIGTTRSRLEMTESVVRNTRGEQVLEQ